MILEFYYSIVLLRLSLSQQAQLGLIIKRKIIDGNILTIKSREKRPIFFNLGCQKSENKLSDWILGFETVKMASQSSTPSFEPVDSKSIEEAIEEDLSFVMADEAIDKVADEMSKSKYSQVIFKSFIVQKFTSLDFLKMLDQLQLKIPLLRFLV